MFMIPQVSKYSVSPANIDSECYKLSRGYYNQESSDVFVVFQDTPLEKWHWPIGYILLLILLIIEKIMFLTSISHFTYFKLSHFE